MLFQNAGTWVENNVVAVALVSVGGYRSLVLNVPLIESPFEEIPFTCPAESSFRKNGLKGTPTRGCVDDGLNNSTDAQFKTNSTSTKIQKPRNRWGGRGKW